MMPSYKYRDSHYKDKTVSRPFYLYNGILRTWKIGLIEMKPRLTQVQVDRDGISMSV